MSGREINTNDDAEANLHKDGMPARIIQFKGQRSCIRLESIYWDVLKDEAQTRNLKLNELVHEYYHNSEASQNKTAFLRRRAVEWLNRKVHKANEKIHLRSSELHSVLRATVQPSIVFSEMQTISRYNRPFRAWLGEHTLSDKKETDYTKLRVTFRRSFKGLLHAIDDGLGSVKNEHVTVLLPGYIIPVMMNIVRIHKTPNQDQLFFGIISNSEEFR